MLNNDESGPHESTGTTYVAKRSNSSTLLYQRPSVSKGDLTWLVHTIFEELQVKECASATGKAAENLVPATLTFVAFMLLALVQGFKHRCTLETDNGRIAHAATLISRRVALISIELCLPCA